MFRVGIGYDSHRFVPDRPFILGGQRIAFDQGLEAYSDGDAVAHAVTDAILGAAGAGDLGAMFPDNDPNWKDADSLHLLRLARERINQMGFHPVQADVTIICERPHLGVYKQAMAPEQLATALQEKWYATGNYHTLYFGEIVATYVDDLA